jgi:hypothetical protein
LDSATTPAVSQSDFYNRIDYMALSFFLRELISELLWGRGRTYAPGVAALKPLGLRGSSADSQTTPGLIFFSSYSNADLRDVAWLLAEGESLGRQKKKPDGSFLSISLFMVSLMQQG